MVPKSIHIKSRVVREVGEEGEWTGSDCRTGPPGLGKKRQNSRQEADAFCFFIRFTPRSGGKEGVSSQSYFEFAE